MSESGRVELTKKSIVEVTEIYSLFRGWLEEQGFCYPPSYKEFDALILKSHRCSGKTKIEGKLFYIGIAIADYEKDY